MSRNEKIKVALITIIAALIAMTVFFPIVANAQDFYEDSNELSIESFLERANNLNLAMMLSFSICLILCRLAETNFLARCAFYGDKFAPFGLYIGYLLTRFIVSRIYKILQK